MPRPKHVRVEANFRTDAQCSSCSWSLASATNDDQWTCQCKRKVCFLQHCIRHKDTHAVLAQCNFCGLARDKVPCPSCFRSQPVASWWRAATLATPAATAAVMNAAAVEGQDAGSRSVVYVLGGYSGSGPEVHGCGMYDPASGDWTPLPDMYTNRCRHGTAVVECVDPRSADPSVTSFKIYVTGGRDASAKRLQTCEVFDTARRRWSRLPSMKCVRSSGCASHTTDGRVLAIAGHNGRANLKSAEEYDPVTKKWTSTSELLKHPNSGCFATRWVATHTGRRMSTGATSYGRDVPSDDDDASVYVLVLGRPLGNTAANIGGEMWSCDKNVWLPLPPPTHQRTAACTCLFNGQVFLIGGYTVPGDSVLSSVEVFDPVTQRWSMSEPMPTARYAAQAAVVDGKLLVMGGCLSDNRRYATVEAFDPELNTWTTLPPLPGPRSHFGVAVLPTREPRASGAARAVAKHAKLAQVTIPAAAAAGHGAAAPATKRSEKSRASRAARSSGDGRAAAAAAARAAVAAPVAAAAASADTTGTAGSAVGLGPRSPATGRSHGLDPRTTVDTGAAAVADADVLRGGASLVDDSPVYRPAPLAAGLSAEAAASAHARDAPAAGRGASARGLAPSPRSRTQPRALRSQALLQSQLAALIDSDGLD